MDFQFRVMNLNSKFHRSQNLYWAGYFVATWLGFTGFATIHLVWQGWSVGGFVLYVGALPVLIALFSLEGFAHLSNRVRVSLNGHLRRGQISRRSLIGWGMASALLFALTIGALIALGSRFGIWGICTAAVGSWLLLAIGPAGMFVTCAQRVSGRKFPEPKTQLSDYFSLSKNSKSPRDAPRQVVSVGDEDELDWMQMQRENAAQKES